MIRACFRRREKGSAVCRIPELLEIVAAIGQNAMGEIPGRALRGEIGQILAAA